MTEEVQDLAPEEIPADLPEGQPEPPAREWSDDDEGEARVFGWKPSAEWVGDLPRGYMEDPREYMERVKRSKTFTAMQERIDSATREASENSRKIAAAYERADQQRKEHYDRALADIAERQREAASKQDLQSYDQLERHKTQLQREQAAPSRPDMPQTPVAPPAVEEYRSRNAWAQDPVIWREMHAAVDAGLQSGHLRSADPAEQLAFAEQSIKLRYPHLFQAATPRPAVPARQQVDGGGIASSRMANPYDKLPADAKAAFAKFAKDGLFSNDDAGKRKFAEDYNNG